MTVTYEMLIGFVGGTVGILSFIFLVINSRASSRRNVEAEAEKYAKLSSDLAYIKQSIDELKKITAATSDKIESIGVRLAVTEAMAVENRKFIREERRGS